MGEDMAKTHKEMLRALLMQDNVDRKTLAKKIGVSPAQITRWLDSAEPRLVHFRKIEELYKQIAG